jgi:hypothetical protein
MHRTKLVTVLSVTVALAVAFAKVKIQSYGFSAGL